MAQYSLGIDIGGTFTDLVVYDHDTGARWSGTCANAKREFTGGK